MEEEDVEVSLEVVSSLNLRTARGDGRMLKEPIDFTCSCGKKCRLGADSFVLAKIHYNLSGDLCEVILCDRCTDILIDAARFGPRVIESGEYWNIQSRAARISIVQDDLYCFKCLDKDGTHLFMKFDDLTKEKVSYGTMRVCAKCTISYLTMLLNSREVENGPISCNPSI